LATVEGARGRVVSIVLLGGFYFWLLFGWGGWLR